MTKILETERLELRKFEPDDAPFILSLVNTPGWLQFIGDRKIKTLEDAKNYIVNAPMYLYHKFGFGPYLVQLKNSSTPIGMCSLIKRDTLEDVDIGYALLPEFSGKGYAYEATLATMNYAGQALGMKKLIAVTNTDNENSVKLLRKLGFGFEKKVRFPDENKELLQFGILTGRKN